MGPPSVGDLYVHATPCQSTNHRSRHFRANGFLVRQSGFESLVYDPDLCISEHKYQNSKGWGGREIHQSVEISVEME